MSFITQEQNAAMAEAARMENAKKTCIAEVYQERQDFTRCMANDRAIIDAIARWSGNPDLLPTRELFNEVLLENPEEIRNFARQPLALAKEQVVEEYLRLLAAHSRQDQYSLKQEENRLKHLPLEVCRQKLQELKSRQKMAQAPVSALKTFVRENTPQPSQWPTLPTSLWSTPQGKTITIDAEYLNHLARHDKYEFVRLCKLYGTAQVDARRGLK
jgi:hypothetical protein